MTGSVSAGGRGVDLTPFPVAGMTHNKDELRTRLLNQVESALYYLFPNGKRRGARFVVGNVQGDAGESLVIEIEGAKRGVWFDFATGESGDVLALWAAVRGFTLPGQFGELLDDLAGWLLVPRANAVAVEFKPSGAPVQDALGAVTGKWEYRSADGDLLAYVYRYDTRQGKQYRPWDVKARAMRMPASRPLYNLPEMASAEVVVLVEGEKCAQALIEVGVVATTAMGGASAGIDKTDWLPLSGKTVVIWPDHDAVGAKYAHAVTRRLCSMGVTVRAVRIPKDKPPKWDAADAVDEGFDIDSLLRAATDPQNDGGEIVTPAEAPKRFNISQWHAVERFVGKPKARRWLVAGVFPMAQAALVAAGGGVGKSFLLLSLAREVAVPDGTFINAPVLFGSSLAEHGVAIYITAEDDAQSKIDIVIVYKIDRLTRSLADFAKMVEVFDQQGVSFSAVTQQINSATSMGRLMLNVLLSFAQFEREVTGERIRDKLAASKAKGMWMGGTPPLGYDVRDRKLVVNEPEAATVRQLWQRFVALRSTTELARELTREGITTKAWTNAKGVARRGTRISKQYLYKALRNPLYIGQIRHKGKVYPGLHEAIIERPLWDQVQSILTEDAGERRVATLTRNSPPALLRGLLFAPNGERMLPTFTCKGKAGRCKQYGYYISASDKKFGRGSNPVGTIPAAAIEALVLREVHAVLQAPEMVQAVWDEIRRRNVALDEPAVVLAMRNLACLWQELFPAEQARLVRLLIERVQFREGGVDIEWHAAGWSTLAGELAPNSIGAELREWEEAA